MLKTAILLSARYSRTGSTPAGTQLKDPERDLKDVFWPEAQLNSVRLMTRRIA